jgi:hypothetical protein
MTEISATTTQGPPPGWVIADLTVMIEADAQHLATALATGHRVQAHGFVDSIIDLSRELEDRQRAAAGE